MLATSRTTIALGLCALLAALAVGCGGSDDGEAFDPGRSTIPAETTGASGATGTSGSSGVTATPTTPTTTAPAPATTEPSGGTPAPATTSPRTTTTAPNPGGASADPPAETAKKAQPPPEQNPACKPGTGAGFPDRPQCEPVDGPDANEDEGP